MRTIVLLALTLLAAGPSRAADRPQDVLAAFVAAFNGRDAAKAAALYTADAELMPPDGAPAKGRAAIEAAFRRQLEDVRVIDTIAVSAEVSGSLAYVSGRLTQSTRTRQHGADIVSGSYLVVLRRVAGRWQIARHMFNLPLRPEFVG
jgi:uncharacterized protein (TIGR02246 family)